MKKMLSCALFSILCATGVCFAIDSNDFEKLVKATANQVIAEAEKVSTCTPSKHEDTLVIIGKTADGTCHYTRGFVEYSGKKVPLQDCYAPMSVMQQAGDNMVATAQKWLKTNSISIDSNNDILSKYCKSQKTVIKITE